MDLQLIVLCGLTFVIYLIGALAYAARYGIEARALATPPKRLKLQAYAENFR